MQRPGLERFRFYGCLRYLYDNILKSRLPSKIGVYNGVAVRDRGLFDVTDERPDYERPLVASVRNHVQTGDQVVIVGGGKGVSTVAAANQAGPDGAVTVYEGGAEGVHKIEQTLRLNRMTDRTTVRHAIVGTAINVYGDVGDAEHVAPAMLPTCDILELDCEGTELEILRNLKISPRVIIVETHAHLDAPEETVREELEQLGYEVVDRGVELAEKGVYILTGRDNSFTSEAT